MNSSFDCNRQQKWYIIREIVSTFFEIVELNNHMPLYLNGCGLFYVRRKFLLANVSILYYDIGMFNAKQVLLLETFDKGLWFKAFNL